ncbi:unnamed protein product, partial [Mesorhabditis spiculigera]
MQMFVLALIALLALHTVAAGPLANDQGQGIVEEYGEPVYELADAAPIDKRAQTFVRFGKRAQTFVRFGKRAQTFVRFGRK